MVKSVCQARELNPGPSAFRAAALPLSYEAGMNLQGTTFEHALLLCELLVTLTAAGFAFKTVDTTGTRLLITGRGFLCEESSRKTLIKCGTRALMPKTCP